MNWETHARALAADTVHPASRWHDPLASTPRHLFVPRWWEWVDDGRVVRDGPEDVERWLNAAYSNDTLVTRLGPLHADQAAPGQIVPPGTWPTSSSTLPSLVVAMYRHAMITDDCDVLVTTGSGYGTALACRRLGDQHVTSVDVDPYLVKAATERCDSIGLHPRTVVCDLTGPLPGTYDRIVSTVAVRHIPASWLVALRPGGRLVTTIAGTGLIVVADKTEDGGASGLTSIDTASFMRTRHGADYDDKPALNDLFAHARQADGDITTSRYPLLYVPDTWDVRSMLELIAPGIDHRQDHDGETRTVYLVHEDGSWARATATGTYGVPQVHQGGPRRLWDQLEKIRNWLNVDGGLPVYGARVVVTPDGVTTLSRSGWTATL
ncbi:methyltransferase domain-containing protein [Streptomyces sp. CBMA152]|uniref:methyltransferase domain-containing protein n=1 Tax=Streptomyces sp. CBMA152 TaxID=1896312 RepID=UPI0016609CAB|nr:methyltransferase domain-containing protein [Streptomyces sp. CBMA152]MBD0744949.1 protein-L-isoaspartate(D-aspartate) O-methyltransferase [Streptomyces sp. CBMA152]